MDVAIPEQDRLGRMDLPAGVIEYQKLRRLGLPATATIGAIEYPTKVRVAILSDEQIVPGFLQCVTADGQRLTVNVTKLAL